MRGSNEITRNTWKMEYNYISLSLDCFSYFTIIAQYVTVFGRNIRIASTDVCRGILYVGTNKKINFLICRGLMSHFNDYILLGNFNIKL